MFIKALIIEIKAFYDIFPYPPGFPNHGAILPGSLLK
jgi:hypothetical protein